MTQLFSAFFTLMYLEISVYRGDILIIAFLHILMCCVFNHPVVSYSL